MKNSLVLFITLFSFALNAQIEEGTYDLSLGEQHGFLIDHEEAEKKMVEQVLQNVLKDYGKIKRNRKAKEWTCENCTLTMISSRPMNIIYKIKEGKDMVTSYIFFDDGEKFLTTYGDKKLEREIDKFLLNIYYEVRRSVIRKEIEGLEKSLSSLDKDLIKLTKKNTKLHEDIEEYKAKIQKAEKDIEKNLHEQEDKRMEIGKQKLNIEKTTKKLNEVGRDS